ncbi:hypothetical protein CAPTEDRAFT_185617, partial [Capitella teleta]
AGSLTLNGSSVTTNQIINTADIANLVFTPAANANGASYASLQFSVNDGTVDSTLNTITFDVTAVNDAPTASDNTLTIDEDTSHTFAASEFGFGDIDTGDTLQSVKITNLPVAGSLMLNGAAVTSNQVINAADIANLIFTPEANANGSGYASFQFSVNDGKLSSTSQSINFNVTPVNDAPSTGDNTLAIDEDTSLTFAVSDFGFTDIDTGDSLQSIKVTTLPTEGGLSLSGAAVTANQVINITDIPNLVFTPQTHANGIGYDSFQFTVSDGSTESAPKTFTVDVNPINDAPSAINSTQTIDEDNVYNFSPAEFGFNDVDAGDMLQSIKITSLPAAGSLTLNGSSVNANQVINASDINSLVFAPEDNEHGTGYANISFT